MRVKMHWAVVVLVASSVLLLGCDKAKNHQGNGDGASRWSRVFGGKENEWGFSVQQTQDGGYVATGYTYSYGAGSGDVWLVKVDSAGGQTWARTYGGPLDDWGYSVQQTSDGGYIVVGLTQSSGSGNYDAWLVKTDATGSESWARTYGGASADGGYSVQQTSDGGYILAGYTESFGQGNGDMWLIKTDGNGGLQWSQTYGGPDREFANSVQQTTDGGYIIAGCTYSYGAGAGDLWLVRTNGDGDALWTKTFGGPDGDGISGSAVQRTSDGGFVAASGFTSVMGGRDVWLVRVDANGDTLWTRTFGGASYDWGHAVWQTSDGGFVVAGGTGSYGAGYRDIWIIRTGPGGDTVWTRTYGGTGHEFGFGIEQTSDGGYITVGLTESYGSGNGDLWLVKTDADGDTLASPGQR